QRLCEAYSPRADAYDEPHGVQLMRDDYQDRSENRVHAITTEKKLELRSPTVIVADGDMSAGVSKQTEERAPVPITVANRSGSSVALKQIDLTGVGAVTFLVAAPAQYQAKGGKIAVHLDAPTGTLLGESEPILPTAD